MLVLNLFNIHPELSRGGLLFIQCSPRANLGIIHGCIFIELSLSFLTLSYTVADLFNRCCEKLLK